MAKKYDPTKDYSLEIKKAQQSGASQEYINQLREERQNKIDDKYGGKDPYQGTSDIMGNRGSQSSWEPEFHELDEAPHHASGGTRPKEAESIFYTPNRNTMYAPGVGRPPVKERRFKRDPSLANKRIRMGDSTVVFDENGIQIQTLRDGGASATDVYHTQKAGLSPNYEAAYVAAQKGNWDDVGYWMGKIDEEENPGAPVDGRDTTKSHDYYSELLLEFPESSANFQRNKYDSVYGTGAYDDPNFSGSRGGDIDTRYLEEAIKNAGGGILPAAPAFGVGNRTTSTTSKGGGFGIGGFGGAGNPPANSAEAYLRQLYEAKQEAENARLKAMYDMQAEKVKEQDDLLGDIYADKRNQVAAQNDLERMRMNEMGIANGLNTGATGQLALGQSMAYQGALGQLAGQQAQDQAANDRLLMELLNQYNNGVAQSQANTDAQLADALYREYLRQDEIARQAAAQEAAQIQMQQNMEAQASQEEWERQLAIWKLQTDLAKKGLAPAPDFSSFYGVDSTPTAPVAPVAPAPAPAPRPTIDNQGYSNDVIARVQSAIGASPDGLWGPESIRKADGRTLADLVALYGKPTPTMNPGFFAYAGGGNDVAFRANVLEAARESGKITDAQLDEELRKLGY